MLDDLLGRLAGRPAPPELAVRVVGHRFSRESHGLKDFLARNHVPVPLARRRLRPGGHAAAERGGRRRRDAAAGRLPGRRDVRSRRRTARARRPDGAAHAGRARLLRPGDRRRRAGRARGGGLRRVGGAADGLVEREAPGGQAGQSSRIENYLGFPVGLSGADLARRATAQARRFGAEFLAVREVTGIEARGPARACAARRRRARRATTWSSRRASRTGGSASPAATRSAAAASTTAPRAARPSRARRGRLRRRRRQLGRPGGASTSPACGRVTLLCRGASLTAACRSYLVDQIEDVDNVEVRSCDRARRAARRGAAGGRSR